MSENETNVETITTSECWPEHFGHSNWHEEIPKDVELPLNCLNELISHMSSMTVSELDIFQALMLAAGQIAGSLAFNEFNPYDEKEELLCGGFNIANIECMKVVEMEMLDIQCQAI